MKYIASLEINYKINLTIHYPGYDVWLGNSRGTVYSREHKTMDPDKDKVFWKYTWQDMAEKDLPAIINYTLDHTTYQQVHYIGHSQGSQIFYKQITSYSNISMNS